LSRRHKAETLAWPSTGTPACAMVGNSPSSHVYSPQLRTLMHLQALIHRWRSEGIELLPPESPTAVEATFERLGSRATRDVVALFSSLGGMDKMDDGYLKLWSLQEMEQENLARSEFGPIFADYLISCWCFRLLPVNDETSAVYVDHFHRPPELVASSLAEFLATYERDPKAAHAW
jgi:hypothetical protein